MTSKDTVESARRFLWDEDGDAPPGSRPSATAPAGGGRFAGGRGENYVDQSVNLMAMGDTSPASGARGMGGGGDAELGGGAAGGGGGVVNRVAGLFRSGPASTSGATGPRLDEYGDASPSTEAEEYLDNDKHRRRISPIFASLYATWNKCLDSCAMTCGRMGLGKIIGASLLAIILLVLVFRGWLHAGGKSKVGREEEIVTRIVNSGISDEDIIKSKNTPQQLALQWIVKDDPAKLSTDHDDLLERYILAVFYHSTTAKLEGWKKENNWLSKKGICSWYGVRCVPIVNPNPNSSEEPMLEQYDDNAPVLKLELAGNEMEGTIPTEMAGFPSLISLDLSNNEMSGGIPTELGKMFAIKDINLRKNKFVGPLPSELGQLSSTLHTLNFGNNQITGTIPTEFGYMESLRAFGATSNLLGGYLPTELADCTKLEFFYIDDNQIVGTIPAYLKKWTSLMELRLSLNRLTGSIPYEEFFPLKALEILHLDGNELTGSIPDFWEHTSRLSDIRLDKNQLTGTIPVIIGHLKNLKNLHMGHNKLNGPIPYQLGLLGDVDVIALNNNLLTGTVPTMLGFLDDISTLMLNYNKLTGTIPTELGTCFRMKDLRLDNNQLTGIIPTEFGGLAEVETFRVFSNSITGTEMPNQVCNLVTTGRLTFLVADCPDDVACSCCHRCGA